MVALKPQESSQRDLAGTGRSQKPSLDKRKELRKGSY